MLKIFKKHFDAKWIYDESRSFIITVFAFLMVDGVAQLTAVYSGDLSKDALIALGMAVGRSVIKSVFTLAFPSIFPKRSS